MSGEEKKTGRARGTVRLQADLQPHLRARLERDMDLIGHDGKRRMVSLGMVLVGAMDSDARRRMASMLAVRESQSIAESIEQELWAVRVLAAVSQLPRPDQELLADGLSDAETRDMLLAWLRGGPAGPAAPPASPPSPADPPSRPRTPKGRSGRGRSGR